MARIVEMEPAPACEPLVNPLTQAALHGIARALASVGRAFICLDPSFRIVHVSNLLNEFLGGGIAAAYPSGGIVQKVHDWYVNVTHYHAFQNSITRPWISGQGAIPGRGVTSKMSKNSLAIGLAKSF